jgi:citrate synthase
MGGYGGGGGGGGGQAMGGGMGGMGGGMMGGMGGMGGGGMGGMGMGMMNVAPERVAKFKATTVCLEHGKPTPRSSMKYEIVPIEQVTDKAAVREVCRRLGVGQVPQRAAQAAAWHLNNDMTWEQLLKKELRSMAGNRPYFSADEIKAAMQISLQAVNVAEQKKSNAPAEPKKYSDAQSVSQN